MKARFAPILLCILSAACTGVDLAHISPTGDFAVPDGVRLGMGASRLRNERGDVRFSPYRGFYEERDGTGILYEFGSVWETHVARFAKLQLVMVSRTFASWDAAATEWRELVAAMKTLHGAPNHCEAIDGPSAGTSATWEIDGIVVTASARQPLDIGSEMSPDRVVLTFATDLGSAGPGRKRVDCE